MKLEIHSGLTEGQVLQRVGQRGANACLTGTTEETAPVFATIREEATPLSGWSRRRVGRSLSGSFTIKLKSIPAGGPYHLELVCGSAHLSIKSFYVGDVWLLAGQSNMEGCGRAGPEVAKAHPLIRAFSMRREWRQAIDPLHVLLESPDSCHNGGRQCTPREAEQYRRTTTGGIGVGLFFAHEMLAKTGVPQGLVCTAHGGTSMEQWNPRHKALGGASQYGSFLLSARATGQPFAGMLWYQGEGDASIELAAVYTDRMKKLVAASRRDLRQPTLPWIIVQIARVFRVRCTDSWNSIQDQQRLFPSKIKHLETIAAIDLELDDPIHIGTSAFPRLGRRLAHAADRLALRNRREQPAPRLRAIAPFKADKTTGIGFLDVSFDYVVGGLRSMGEPQGFSLVDASDRPIPVIFKTTLCGDTARLHLCSGILPDRLKLGYGVGLTPICNITDARDYALPVFTPLTREEALLPFVIRWSKTPVITEPKVSFANISCPHVSTHPEAVVSTYGSDGFVNEHALWMDKGGQASFSAKIELSEQMTLDVLTGYDGPFRLWIDGVSFYDALDGISPCVPDKGSKVIRLPAGEHTFTVAIDLNRGATWGFFLRFRRRDVTRTQLKAGSYAKPSYNV